MIYPTRCQIVDIAGAELLPGIVAKTPAVSRAHIGKFGMAEQLDEWTVRITLDDGTLLWGYECWWRPVEAEAT